MAFVDYEHWYYGYRNKFQMKPNIEEWIEELNDEYDMKKIYVFGDFSRYNIGTDLDRVKGITKNVVFAGRIDRAELWSEEAFDEHMRKVTKKDIREAAARLYANGIQF